MRYVRDIGRIGLALAIGIGCAQTSAAAQRVQPAYIPDTSELEHRLKSESKATVLSLLGTFVPVALGVTVWAVQGPDSVFHYDESGVLKWKRLETPSRAVPVALILTGVVFGPSLGHFYVGGAGGLPLRLGIGSLSMLAAAGGSSAAGGGWDGLGVAAGVMAAGFVVIVIDAFYDIARVGGSVREHNEHVMSELVITPMYSFETRAAGVQIRLTL
jgi:hypothetical protein